MTEGRGYALKSDAGQLDADRFEALDTEGRRALEDGDAETAAETLRAGIACWRGPAFADFAYDAFAQAEIARLEESRLAALEARVDADLALGRHAAVVGELEALVREHPNRERLVAQLMLALYRSRRQADALQTYRTARQTRLDELGLEPGPQLRELERAILAQDPALAHTPRSRSRPRPPPSSPRRGWRSGTLIAGGAAILLVALAVLVTQLAGSGASVVHVAPNSLAAIDTSDDHVVAAVPVGARPGPVVAGADSVWVGNLDDQTVSRIDPRA